jgi:RHS repeat-associated protein
VDNELGLVYLRARYYDPIIGRFIQEDSFSGYSSDARSLNLYVYAWNNPVKYTDFTGQDVLQDVEETWNFFLGDDPISKYARTLFWQDVDHFSRAYDNEIHAMATGIGMVPVAGDVWRDNILFFFGKMENREEFLVRQGFNLPGVVVDATGAGVATQALAKFGSGVWRENTLYALGYTKSQADFLVEQLLNTGELGDLAGVDHMEKLADLIALLREIHPHSGSPDQTDGMFIGSDEDGNVAGRGMGNSPSSSK